MSWWTEEISYETAVKFLKELQAYTTKMLKIGPPDLRHARFSHVIPTSLKPFVPKGAIISSTECQNGWNALRSVERKNFGIHFLVANQEPKFGHNHGFELITDLPTVIMMPMGWESIVEHGSFLSEITWGIALRNIGMLRPYYSPIGGQPTPIFMGEERLADFKAKPQPKSYKFYWWNNLWREEFTHDVDRVRGYYYEAVSIRQVTSLVILLRVLNAYTKLDPSFVVPSNCVSGMSPPFPALDWSIIRDLVFNNLDQEVDLPYSRRGFDQDLGPALNSSDVYIEDLCRRHRWRSENEGNNLAFLYNKESMGEFRRESVRYEYVSKLRSLGYHVNMEEDPTLDIAAKMFMMSLKKTGYPMSEATHLIDKYQPILLK